jgi:diketogulonate reductase-like aldo/keto reductase
LIELHKQGRARSIGVSNFHIPYLQRILDETGVVPVLNQIELHPHFQQTALREFHAQHKIATEAWSPLGQGQLFNDATIVALAKKYGRSPAQIILRWHLDSGHIAIPKSVTPQRIRENFAIFDFHLDDDDMRAIAALDNPRGRVGPDPDTAEF